MSPEEDDKVCAERWRALMAMPHVHTVGWAGYDPELRAKNGSHEDYRHLSVDFTTMVDNSGLKDETLESIRLKEIEIKRKLTEAVDIVRKLQPDVVKTKSGEHKYRDGWLHLTQEIRRRQAAAVGVDNEQYYLLQYLASRYGLGETYGPWIEPLVDSVKKVDDWDDLEYRHAYVQASVEQGLGWQVKINRQLRGWTEEQLAAKCNVAPGYIRNLERGEIPDAEINFVDLRLIGEAFDIALLVGYVSFGELREASKALAEEDLCVPSYDEDKHHVKLTETIETNIERYPPQET
jgi:transcriptional regulator with XRE-family HTH domain